MKTLYQIVGRPQDNGNLDMISVDQLLEEFPSAYFALSSKHLRSELQNQPSIDGLCGPMWGGWRDADGNSVFLEDNSDPTSTPKSYSPSKGPIVACVVRYETWEAYEVLSR